jgi:hypothetical protein
VNKSGEDYNTLTLWEDAKDGNIVAAETVQIADCYDDDGTLIENPIIISGWVTSSTYYIHIKAADGNRHNGTIATGFHLKTTAETAVDLLIEEGWVRLSGCIIEKNSTG